MTRSPTAQDAARGAAEIFLKRDLFRRRLDGAVITPDFARLHYPCYWHYDILFALKVLAEMDLILDPRCGPALDLLEAKQLPDGGFPAEGKYYRVTDKLVSGRSRVDWGLVSARRANDFVTVDALAVLRAAGRYQPAPTLEFAHHPQG